MNLRRKIAFALAFVFLFSSLCSCALDLSFLLGDTPSAEELIALNREEAEERLAAPSDVPAETAFREKFYNQLTANEKAIYDAILAKGAGVKIEVRLPNPVFVACLPGEELSEEMKDVLAGELNEKIKNALVALWLDEPSYFWGEIGLAGQNYSYQSQTTEYGNLEITKLSFTAASSEKFSGIEAQAWDELYEAACSVEISGETVVEKVKSINRALCELADYDYGENGAYPHAALGVFRDGLVVCEGFARAFQLLCYIHNIPCVCVVGMGVTDTKTEGHMWNYVQAEDGKWYGVDVTWNENTSSEVYLFCGENTPCHSRTFGEGHLAETDFTEEGRGVLLPLLEEDGLFSGVAVGDAEAGIS